MQVLDLGMGLGPELESSDTRLFSAGVTCCNRRSPQQREAVGTVVQVPRAPLNLNGGVKESLTT